MISFFQILGAMGLLLITIGILIKKRKTQDLFYFIGGICLESYSIYTGDLIFIILQGIFTLATLYDFIKLKFSKK